MFKTKVPTSINLEWRDNFLNFFLYHKSERTVKPIPPIIKRSDIIILISGSPTYPIKLSDHRANPALLNADMA